MDSSPFQALRSRLHNRLHLWTFLGVYAPFVGSILVQEFHSLSSWSWARWAFISLTPLVFLGGTVWVSPLPWQMGEERGVRPVWRVAGAFLFAEAYMVFMLALDYGLRRMAGAPTAFAASLVSHLTFHGPCLALIGGVQAHRERLDLEKEEARAAAREAQSRALQNQLNPHVLFNALNGLAELVQKSPVDAEQSIRHLSELLRKVLTASEQDQARLSEERALLEDYLDMERLRLGARLELTWDWDSRLDQLWMPPLLLQPLVENAIKHGIAPSRGGGILVIRAKKDGSDVSLSVCNTGHRIAQTNSKEGVGLRNLRARLGLCFGPHASLRLHSEADWTVAEIRVASAGLKMEAA